MIKDQTQENGYFYSNGYSGCLSRTTDQSILKRSIVEWKRTPYQGIFAGLMIDGNGVESQVMWLSPIFILVILKHSLCYQHWMKIFECFNIRHKEHFKHGLNLEKNTKQEGKKKQSMLFLLPKDIPPWIKSNPIWQTKFPSRNLNAHILWSQGKKVNLSIAVDVLVWPM